MIMTAPTAGDARGFGGHTPGFVFRVAELQSQRRELKAAVSRECRRQGVMPPAEPTEPVDDVLAAMARGDLDAARAACRTRPERWPVYRLDAALGRFLWPEHAGEFARTVELLGPASGW